MGSSSIVDIDGRGAASSIDCSLATQPTQITLFAAGDDIYKVL